VEEDVARILVIESDDDVQVFLAQLLRRAGYEVLTASDPAAAAVVARRWRPQVILVEMSHPAADTLAPAHQLLRQDATADIPLIAMTSRSHLDAQHARALGYAGSIAKPFHIRELLDRVAAHVAEIPGSNGPA
jgi:DNA-binding response OmpR family regulator